MLDLFPDEDKPEWKLFISYPEDCDDYNVFISRLSSATEAFKWQNITDVSDDKYIESIKLCDVLIVLSGLWDNNKELINKHIRAAQTFEKPVVVIRPYGAEEIPLELQDDSTRVIGWNTACIVDAILESMDMV
ncbi:MAG: hypothetical protein LUG89_05720 [Methanosphaera sp.]|nr:hypothetical protein [Methanosphaera sp.]